MTNSNTPRLQILTPAEMLSIIDPADPDKFMHQDANGIFEIFWLNFDMEDVYSELAELKKNPRVYIESINQTDEKTICRMGIKAE